MGSNFLGDQTRFSSSRKSKKSNTDKPKPPQRGLGVAQLEKIRISSQMGIHGPSFYHHEDENSHTPYPSSHAYACQGYQEIMVGMPDSNTTNVTYGDPMIHTIARWHHIDVPLEQHFIGQNSTRPFFVSDVEESKDTVEKDFMESSDHLKSESISSTEIDLELRLSL